jgi:hypothetical protein
MPPLTLLRSATETAPCRVVLKLTLHRQYFAEIAAGTKKIERLKVSSTTVRLLANQ